MHHFSRFITHLSVNVFYLNYFMVSNQQFLRFVCCDLKCMFVPGASPDTYLLLKSLHHDTVPPNVSQE